MCAFFVTSAFNWGVGLKNAIQIAHFRRQNVREIDLADNGLLHMLFFADRYKRIMEYLQRNEALFSQLRKKACSINQPRMTSSPFQSLQLCTSYHALQLS